MAMGMQDMRLAAAFALVAVSTSAAAQQPRSIVGDWTTAGQPCTPTAGAIRIGPMELAADELVCSFSSVRREGPSVIWQGACRGTDDQNQRGTVRATEANNRLTITFPNGSRAANLIRCRMR
jgi:hypothetical protein